MILFETLARRWFAFAFVAAFFWVAVPERGWRRALRFLAIAAAFSWIAEYLSTHSAFPYGRYTYTGLTRGDEIYLSNVPLFVPVSFGVVVWAGRTLAVASGIARRQAFLVLGGAGAAALIDLVIDPMTARGQQWFLGHLYFYESTGSWFGIPWSNTAGWIGVSAVILYTDELLETNQRTVIRPGRGLVLAFSMCAFFVLLALVTGNFRIAAVTGLLSAGMAWATVGRARAEPQPEAEA